MLVVVFVVGFTVAVACIALDFLQVGCCYVVVCSAVVAVGWVSLCGDVGSRHVAMHRIVKFK